jgi:hypothetical protein
MWNKVKNWIDVATTWIYSHFFAALFMTIIVGLATIYFDYGSKKLFFLVFVLGVSYRYVRMGVNWVFNR